MLTKTYYLSLLQCIIRNKVMQARGGNTLTFSRPSFWGNGKFPDKLDDALSTIKEICSSSKSCKNCIFNVKLSPSYSFCTAMQYYSEYSALKPIEKGDTEEII